MTTALIVVDVQNDFAHPDGNLYVSGGNDVPAKVNKFLDNYDFVVYTKDWHPERTTHFVDHGGSWPQHCVAGTWGAEFHQNLRQKNGSPTVVKGTSPNEDGYSGFSVEGDNGVYSTELDQMLQDEGVTSVDIVGIALDVCVKATALDAVASGYYTTVYIDATAPVTVEGGEQAIEEMQAAGVTVR